MPHPDGDEPDADAVLTRLGLTPSGGRAAGGDDILAATLGLLVALDGPSVALIADFASRMIVRSDALTQPEQLLFTRACSEPVRRGASGRAQARAALQHYCLDRRKGGRPPRLADDRQPPHPPCAGRSAGPHRKTGCRRLADARHPRRPRASLEAIADAERELVDATEGKLRRPSSLRQSLLFCSRASFGCRHSGAPQRPRVSAGLKLSRGRFLQLVVKRGVVNVA